MIPSVSVIIPTANRSRSFLADAITSALSQTLEPEEVLVIDNGSERVPENFHLDRKVRVLRIRAASGASVARNYGAEFARTEFLAFLDDDDWWDPHFLEEALGVAIERQLDCVYGRLDSSDGGATVRYKCATEEDLNIPTLMRRNPGLGGQNLLIRRSLYVAIGGFDPRLSCSHDRALPISLINEGHRIGIAPRAIAIRRDHQSPRLTQHPFSQVHFLWLYRKHLPQGVWLKEFLRLTAHALRKSIRYLSLRRKSSMGVAGAS